RTAKKILTRTGIELWLKNGAASNTPPIRTKIRKMRSKNSGLSAGSILKWKLEMLSFRPESEMPGYSRNVIPGRNRSPDQQTHPQPFRRDWVKRRVGFNAKCWGGT